MPEQRHRRRPEATGEVPAPHRSGLARGGSTVQSRTEVAERKFHCDACGANVEFAPGPSVLRCPYCGTEKRIPTSEEEVGELELASALRRFGDAPSLERRVVACAACGASTRIEGGVTASRCAFCDAPITSPPTSQRVLAVQGVLPFAVEARAANSAFGAWLRSRWFAPSDLGRRARRDGLDGVYLPFFTFDASSETFYRGLRGDAYWVEERFIAQQDGRPVERTRRVRHVRWSPRSGTVWLTFDDVLVLASRGLPERLVRSLEPWDLGAIVPFDERFLSGFQAECDQRGLKAAFEDFQARCAPAIEQEIRRDIGGDEQQIQGSRTAFTQVTFKHVLLPVWIGAFRYGDRVYRVVVNAQTGEVQGERPWSALKVGAALFALLVLGLVLYAWLGDGGDGVVPYPG